MSKPRLHVSGLRIAISPETEDGVYVPDDDETNELLALKYVDEVGSYGAQDYMIFAHFDELEDYNDNLVKVMTKILQIVCKYH